MTEIALHRIDAFLLDLDGVVTRTAVVHAAAWKRLFDELLARRAAGGAWRPFDLDRDYRTHVDGKPRRDGVRSFLASRGIEVPEGAPRDPAGSDTIHGLARRKNGYVLAELAQHGVEAHGDAVRLLGRARNRGLRTAVVTSSENGAAVLAAAGIGELFDVRVDGTDVHRLGLRGKPHPDSFLEAARRLGVAPGRAVVLEDAIAGVEAGRAGGFALVVGVDRAGQAAALRDAGAEVVLASLDELVLTGEPAARRLP